MVLKYPDLHDWFMMRLGYDEKGDKVGQDKWGTLFYAEASKEQIMFVRDRLVRAFSDTWANRPYQGDNPYAETDAQRKARLSNFVVIGTHRSKGCELPVYYLKFGDNVSQAPLEIVMRNNFHNWNVSVRSSVPLQGSFKELISDSTSYCFFEGFPSRFKFNAYSDTNNRDFSFHLNNNEELWTFFWLMFHKEMADKPWFILEDPLIRQEGADSEIQN